MGLEAAIRHGQAYEPAEVLPDGRVLWGHPDAPGLVELSPAQMTAYGLVDKARAAINDRVEAHALEPVSASPLPAPSPPVGVPAGGVAAGYRWQPVQDGDDLLWAIDNRPTLDQHDPANGSYPELQRLVVPDEVLRRIVH